MMKLSILFLLLTVAINVMGQNESETVQMVIDWQIGDKRLVETKTSSKFKVNDSLITSFDVSGSYIIEVLDTTDGYLLSYKQGETDFSMLLEGIPGLADSSSNMIKQIFTSIIEHMSGAELLVFVDRNSGLATDIRNREEVLKSVKDACFVTIQEIGKSKKNSEEVIEELNSKIDGMVAGMSHKIILTVINEVNLILQMYAVEFVVNSTITHDVLVYDVNALGPYADAEIPAQLNVQSRENNDFTMHITAETFYDQEALNKILREENPDIDENADLINIEEKEVYKFDLETGWIINYSQYMRFEMDSTIGESTITTVFTKI